MTHVVDPEWLDFVRTICGTTPERAGIRELLEAWAELTPDDREQLLRVLRARAEALREPAPPAPAGAHPMP